jgi:hypothetical protein
MYSEEKRIESKTPECSMYTYRIGLHDITNYDCGLLGYNTTILCVVTKVSEKSVAFNFGTEVCKCQYVQNVYLSFHMIRTNKMLQQRPRTVKFVC